MKSFRVTPDSYCLFKDVKFFKILEEGYEMCCPVCIKTIFYYDLNNVYDFTARCANCHASMSLFFGDTIEYPCSVVTV